MKKWTDNDCWMYSLELKDQPSVHVAVRSQGIQILSNFDEGKKFMTFRTKYI